MTAQLGLFPSTNFNPPTIPQPNLFGSTTPETPLTEGIKYAGSKLKILPYIIEAISDLGVHHVLDGFSGSTRVSQALSKLNFRVTSCDISDWSEVFGKCYLYNQQPVAYYSDLINHLNSIPGEDGWFTKYYGGDLVCPEKRPFQKKNTRKLDAIRKEIDRLNLSNLDKCVALSSLILALDSVDSTMGHYVSYLADWSPRSFNDLVLKIPALFINNELHEVLKGDIFQLIDNKTYDLAYLDPPYGSNNEKMPPSRVRYSSYYHIWSTVIKNDHPKIFGKVNRREDTRDNVSSSVFEEYRKDSTGHFIAMKAIDKLIRKVNAEYILLSYSSGGRATKEELYDILNSNGSLIKAIEIDYKKNVMGNMRWTNEWINSDGQYQEFLFLIKKH